MKTIGMTSARAALCLLTPLVLSHGLCASSGEETEKEVERILSASRKIQPEAVPVHAAQLLALGEEAWAPMWSALAKSRSMKIDEEELTGKDRVLFNALAQSGVARLRQFLNEHGRQDDASRVASLRLLGAHGESRDMQFMLSLATSDPLEPPPSLRRVAVLEDGLTRIFHAHPRSLENFDPGMSDVHPSLVPAVLRAVGGSEQGRGLRVLIQYLLFSTNHKPVAMAGITSLAPMATGLERRDACREVRELLFSNDEMIVQSALRALGTLEHDEAVDDILEVLEDAQRAIEQDAMWALERITGLSFRSGVEGWRRWHEEETAWFEARWDPTLEALESSDIAMVVDAIRVLSRKKLRRDFVSSYLVVLLDHEDATARELTCFALRELRSSDSIRPMIVLLESEEEPAVRKAARDTLAELTSQDLPDEAELWFDWYRSAHEGGY